MSARDELINGLTEHACCFSEEDAKRMVDAFAHELAEKIRVKASELIDEAGPRTTPSDPKYDKAAGAVLGADLIDPVKDTR